MKRVDSVISLIYSLSKSEKKHFSLQVIKDKEEKDYLVIYDIPKIRNYHPIHD